MQVSRIASGVYDVLFNGARFELEKYDDGQWLLFEAAKDEYSGREYMQHFATKRDAISCLRK